MSENSRIEWTHHTFNPWWGCTKVSPGCDHCYAERDAIRYGYRESGHHFPIWGKDAQRRFFGDNHWARPLNWNKKAEAAGERHRVFCASYADVMEDIGGSNTVLDDERAKLWRLIASTPALQWLLLTKRPQFFRRYLPLAWLEDPPLNVMLMTTVESSDYLWRVDRLMSTPAAMRGISYEPALGPVDFSRYLTPYANPFLQQYRNVKIGPLNEWIVDVDGAHTLWRGIDWAIIGGESGPGARPFNVQWAIDAVQQCRDAGVAPFMKQIGAKPHFNGIPVIISDRKGAVMDEWPFSVRVREFPCS